jgi:putative endonuclease
MKKIGNLGEDFVAQWLKNNNYEILHQRWSYRWGEIDIIAQEKGTLELAFVEVKTRSFRNWDEDGLLAINFNKQEKLLQTAAIFLSQNSELAELPCSFDIALVGYKPSNKTTVNNSESETIIKLNKPTIWQGYILTLKEYIKGALISSDTMG